MAEFRCYLLDSDREVMAVEVIRALTLPRAVTKGILAAVMRQATTFELWRNDFCVYAHQSPAASTSAKARTPRATMARKAVDG